MFDLTEVNLNQLISGILAECSREIEEKKAKTEVKLPAKTVMEGNQSLLYSIFRNLLDNALAYAGENIKITINCYKEDSKYYYFSFSDNGVGIPAEHINRIFERFYRVDKGRSRKIGGTGLGLSIVKHAVQYHHGDIRLTSKPGEGTVIRITFPAAAQ